MDGKDERLMFQIGLTLIPGVGDVLGKKLVSICGSAEALFRESRQRLRKMPRVGELLANSLDDKEILLRAEKEVAFVERYRITPLYFQDTCYPHRLKQCLDSPILLFYKGTADLNSPRMIGIVGTRRATEYGKMVTHELVEGLVRQQVVVVSGLAYGIDSCAHRSSLEMGLKTIGVLGHGLDTLYPWLHRSLAEKMVGQGGLITEFLSGTKPDRTNFPKRNRIIAGMCDAVVVVEAGPKGGALITADIANSYNRDVFAVPGRVCDPFSEGPNWLVRTNRAALIQKADDIEYLMGWKEENISHHPCQRKIFVELTAEEEKIVKLLQDHEQLGIDELCIQSENPMSKVSASLLNLEFEGIIRCLPGKIYVLV
ncbi:MAG: DNA-processing protein DprA [Bacteroidota bacterium]